MTKRLESTPGGGPPRQMPQGKRFQPGQSGNPKGGPLRQPEVRALLKENLVKGLEKILELMEHEDVEHQKWAVQMLFKYGCPVPGPEPVGAPNRLEELAKLLRGGGGTPQH